jgi:hypothetical protein
MVMSFSTRFAKSCWLRCLVSVAGKITDDAAEYLSLSVKVDAYAITHYIWMLNELVREYRDIRSHRRVIEELSVAAKDDSITDEGYEVIRDKVRRRNRTEVSDALQ